jgi:hypothetical protein
MELVNAIVIARERVGFINVHSTGEEARSYPKPPPRTHD